MNAIAIAIIFLLRFAIPIIILFTIGELIRRREAKYWTQT